jgi:hypothetical protein
MFSAPASRPIRDLDPVSLGESHIHTPQSAATLVLTGAASPNASRRNRVFITRPSRHEGEQRIDGLAGVKIWFALDDLACEGGVLPIPLKAYLH